MTRFLILSLLLLICVAKEISGQGTVEGVVSDAATGETLVGANVVYATGQGTVTDVNGFFSLSLEPGTYQLSVSFVGYVAQNKEITIDDGLLVENFELKGITLTEVEVVADMATSRETPVAFSTINPVEIREQLASQDIPMILNRTPGVYATAQGGGDGDARINIRGFSQRNIAVMIDGIPVNDMENGWVYWSNWFGLDIVTQKIQVQRGLGASKLALPSVGGTMNIITAGIQNKRKFSFEQEVGNDGFFRTSLGITSGKLKGDWGVTAAASYKQGRGWVDQAYTRGWFYYLKVDKRLGKHILSLSAMGAPQEHAQRRYKKPLATWDAEYAKEQGVSLAAEEYFNTTYIDPRYMYDKGLRYNPDWGKYVNTDGEEITQSTKINYYHKPMFTLRDFWNVNDKLYLSNILYLSMGSGGGTSLKKSVRANPDDPEKGFITPEGQIDLQQYYDINIENFDPQFPDQPKSYQFIRSNVNNHFWYGLLSTFNYEITEELVLSGGIDLRRYKGEHYEEIYDLLGGTYTKDQGNKNRNPNTQLTEGDQINYHNDGIVQWGGLFGQIEYKRGNLSLFANLTGAYSGYKKIDYFAPKVLEVDGETLYIEWGKPVEHNGTFYTEQSPGLKYQESDWKWIPGFTFKTGANYNLTERSNIFLNLGYLSIAPKFNNVYDRYSIELLRNIENENILAFELGYSYQTRKFDLRANSYFTRWLNKPGRPVSYPISEEEVGYGNIQGMDALHMGIELDFNYEILRTLDLRGLLSYGDWRWTSEDSVRLYNDNNQLVRTEYFNAEGVHVGDAAQTQIGLGLRYEPIRYLYFSGTFTYFDRHFSDFNPFDLNPDKNPDSFDENGNPVDAWKTPSYYIIDLHAGYSYKIKTVILSLRFSVLNLLDNIYISDASDNDEFSTVTKGHDATSAGVFYGLGRRFNVSFSINF